MLCGLRNSDDIFNVYLSVVHGCTFAKIEICIAFHTSESEAWKLKISC